MTAPAGDGEFRTITALSKGEYSTYRVICLFEDPADAARAKVEMNTGDGHGEYFTEQLVILPAGRIPRPVKIYRAALYPHVVENPEGLRVIEFRDLMPWEVPGYGLDDSKPVKEVLPATSLRAPEIAVWVGTDQAQVLAAAQARIAELRAQDGASS